MVDVAEKSMEELVSLCKRRGFVYPASEIYGGINGFWDYGPLGVALKNAVRDDWWRNMVECPPVGPDGDVLQVVGLDSSIIQNPKTWEASGHVGGFNDPMVDCTESKKRYRADHAWVVGFHGGEEDADSNSSSGVVPEHFYAVVADSKETAIEAAKSEMPKKFAKRVADATAVTAFDQTNLAPDWPRLSPATQTATLTEPRMFNLMFETYVGAIRDEDAKAYLRPETAQGIFLNYKNILDTMRVKVPFGIAQVGKAFRNEVTPRNFIFRSREFEQMEMEWFCHPDDALKWYDFWKHERMRWWKSLGIDEGNLIFRDHDEDELAHYSSACVDVEYRYPFTAPGYGELEGIAHRGCYDLSKHTEHSKQKLEFFDQTNNEKFVPHVIEPASGLTRGVLVLLCEAFTPTPERKGSKYVMNFPARLAPIKVGVFPLVNKDGMPEKANALYMKLREKYVCQYDVKQSIGKRYARMDEAGTPYCVTVDGETNENGNVTIRHRDTAEQEQVHIDRVEEFLGEKLG